jgi:amino-acid N-acetyltransferase
MLRKATLEDVEKIRVLIEANLDKLLPRTAEDIQELIDWFWVVAEGDEIVGCCCLEIYSPKIAEIRSIAVREDRRGNGYGEQLVEVAINEATRRNIKQVLVVTSTPEFFEKMNFGPCLNEKYALFWVGDSDNAQSV